MASLSWQSTSFPILIIFLHCQHLQIRVLILYLILEVVHTHRKVIIPAKYECGGSSALHNGNIFEYGSLWREVQFLRVLILEVVPLHRKVMIPGKYECGGISALQGDHDFGC